MSRVPSHRRGIFSIEIFHKGVLHGMNSPERGFSEGNISIGGGGNLQEELSMEEKISGMILKS